MMKKFVILLAFLAVTVAAGAKGRDSIGTKPRYKLPEKGWEFGLGVSVMQFNRIRLSDISTSSRGSYIDMQLRHAVWGGNLYVARRLSNVFALDLQGVLGGADGKFLGQAGVGLQWRLGHYFGSRYIDPYLRVGVNYMYKGFDIYYSDSKNGVSWQMANEMNKDGSDSRHLFAIAAGVGVNMWLNDNWGVGLQGDYMAIPMHNIANSLRGTVRVMWRFGPKRYSPDPQGDTAPTGRGGNGGGNGRGNDGRNGRGRVVHDTVWIVDRANVYEMMHEIHFGFDSAELEDEHLEWIEKIATILREDASRHFLLTGYADAHGSVAYDEELSRQRAEAMKRALVNAGVPPEMLKTKGGGKRITHAAYRADDATRAGDRKVVIELIENDAYWKIL